jgi:hypothetical protein
LKIISRNEKQVRIQRVGSGYITKFHMQRAKIWRILKREAWHGG